MKSIGVRLTLTMLCIVLLGICITVSVSTVISGKELIHSSLANLQNETGREAAKMNAWIDDQKSTIGALADTLTQLEDFSEAQQAAIFKAIIDSNSDYFEVYMGYPNGFATTGTGNQFDYSWWHAYERGWYRLAMEANGNVSVTSPYVDAMTGELCITVCRSVYKNGELRGVVAADIFVTDLDNMTKAVNLNSEGYAMLLDTNGDILVHPNAQYAPDKEGNCQNVSSAADGAYAGLWEQISTSDGIFKYDDASGIANYYTVNTLDACGWRLMTVLPAKVVTHTIMTTILIIIPLTFAILIIAAFLIFLTIRSMITRPITKLATAADHLSRGDTGIQVEYGYRGELKTLAKSFQKIINSTNEQAQQIQRLESGDLTVDIQPRCDADTIGNSLGRLVSSLNAMISDIGMSIEQVTLNSRQLADGAQQVASGSTVQAASVERLSAGISTLAENVAFNSEQASRAAELSNSVKIDAEKGNNQMSQMVAAVKEINEASKGIEKVIKVIDDIAFQTNILALNAAVEAARAGSAGKGFAVVAEEVRNLAAKSAEAAKETGGLITNSMEKAALGTQIAEETSASLRGIVDGIMQSTDIINTIAHSGDKQSESISQVYEGISQVSDVAQQNSAAAEESAAVSEGMNDQATMLRQLVSQFKIRKNMA